MSDEPSADQHEPHAIQPHASNAPWKYPDEAREAVFEVWGFQAGRNAERTLRLLEAQPDLLGNYPPPSVSAIRTWARKEDWASRVTARLAATAPRLMAHSAARMLALHPVVLDGLEAAARGEGALNMVQFNAQAKLADLIGLQRISEMSIDAIARSVEEQVDAEDEAILSPEELALKKSRENRERLMERRQRRTGKHRDNYERR